MWLYRLPKIPFYLGQKIARFPRFVAQKSLLVGTLVSCEVKKSPALRRTNIETCSTVVVYVFKKEKKKPSFVGLVWLTNSHIILQSMMTYQIERLPVKRGLSGLSGLFRLQDIIFSDCDNQCERCAGGGGGGKGWGVLPFPRSRASYFRYAPTI